MTESLLIILLILVIINIAIGLFLKPKSEIKSQLNEIETKITQKIDNSLEKTEKSIKDELQRIRIETNNISKENREELTKSLNNFSEQFSRSLKEQNQLLKEEFATMNKQQAEFNKQVNDGNKINRDELGISLKSFENKFGENIKELNELLKGEFVTMNKQQAEFNKQINDGNKTNRNELGNSLKSFENKFGENIKELNELLRQKFTDFSKLQSDISKQSTENIKEVKTSVEKQLETIREDNTKQLDEMRKTVDEKLQKTLNERLSQSFETVSKQLQSVQEGLGEMKTLATDVGGLKKVLSNVKMRGSIGEMQLEMLLEQILAPDQYEANVKTKKSSSDLVEFAIKLPGRDDSGTNVWLPVDAKFPKDIYEQLIDAYEVGDTDNVKLAQKNMVNTIKKMAKDIGDKYLDPPNTTDFGIMFLPFEGIYAEIVRNAALLETIQRDYKVIITGPSTLAAILNSLQMGFRTLAIQKRSSEVWQVLGAVKTEFSKFGGLMDKAQNSIQRGLDQLDEIKGTRTRAINRRLRDIEELSENDTKKILPEIADSNLIIDNE